MAVQMFFILVDTDNTLKSVEEFVCKLFSEFKDLSGSNSFIFMEADEVVSIHPAGVFIPESFFCKPGLIDLIIGNGISGIGSCDFSESFFDLFMAENIFENISHRSVTICGFIDDLIDCHVSAHSFLYSLSCEDISASSLPEGMIPMLFATWAIWFTLVARPRSCFVYSANVQLRSFRTEICSDEGTEA